MSNLSAAFLLVASAALVGISNLCVKSSVARVEPGVTSTSFVLGVLRQPVFICGFLLFGLASLIWIRVLTVVPLSVAYPLFVSFTYVVVATGAMVIFDERLTAPKLLGAGFLIVGIFFISRG